MGRALWDAPGAREITADACPYVWGATYQRLVPARRFFSASSQDMHINYKDVSAVRFAVLSFSHLFRPGARFAVRTDSRVTMGALNAMCSRSPRLKAEVRRLHDAFTTTGLRVEATWLPSLSNAEADRLSRERARTDWRL